jgi:hypothetical protein
MSTWLSENLNAREEVSSGATRLNGWSLASTGREHRYVAFKDGDRTATMVVIPPGEERSISGLNEPFPNGLSIESLTGDGTLIANVFHEPRGPISFPDLEE